MRKKETFKDWIKKWSIDDILNHMFSMGMMYMAERITEQEKEADKKIIIKQKSHLNPSGFFYHWIVIPAFAGTTRN